MQLSEENTTSDCISRQAAIDAIGKKSDELYENIKKGATFPQRQWFDGMAMAQSILENMPSAQPEIIRCGECTHKDKKIDYCHYLGITICERDYCSYGERRTNE